MSRAGQITSRAKRAQWAAFVVKFRRRQAEALNPPAGGCLIMRREDIHLIDEVRETIIATKLECGTVECPKCGKRIAFRVSSYNGHVHARCETLDCIAWME